LVKLPLDYKDLEPGEKRFYSRLVRARRALKVDEIDEYGTWLMFKMRNRKNTPLRIHFLNINSPLVEGCWRKVTPKTGS
jgi:hypothetical protein